MVLSEKDAQLFYKLWLPLIDYVNKKCKINKKLKNIPQAKALNPQEVKEIADVLWNDVSIIDEYLLETGNEISEENREIISNWKCRVQGSFFMERHLKKGTIFVGEDNSVYQVSGIISSWDEMFPFAQLPLLLEATFIPFKDVIISDGLVMAYPIVIGGNMKRQLKDIYMTAKKGQMLIKTLDDMRS